MTLDDMLAWADEMRPSAFSAARLSEWIDDMEAALWAEVLLQPPGLWRSRDPETDGAKRLLLPDAWRKLYTAWLGAMIDYGNGEYALYENEMTLFNTYVNQLSAWYAQRYAPADAPAKWLRLGLVGSAGREGLTLPSGAAVLAVRCRVTDPFDGNGALTLGTEDDPALLLNAAEADPMTAGTYTTPALTLPPPGESLICAVPAGATEGEAVLYVLVQMPAR